ncbi:unnamed protein product [Lymnaea stagnalis]|uniref:G-protein coupled receptors family 1 profile domain-containing protein n=1 Tax=Lymnaea stagnalis TaxID=6523 RepID=A0AAV2HHP1_LYMST
MNVSQCMCVVVTAERLVAVFLPFKFRAVVRPRRASIVVCSLYLFWLGATLVYIRKFNFNFRYLSAYQTCVCDYDLKLNGDEVMFDTVCTWIACYVSLAIIIIGSLTIFTKVKSASRRRGKMTSSKTASCSRTTRTLLAVCGFFGCMQIMRLPYTTSSSFPDRETFMIYFVFVRLASNLNSASNFIIYVILNKKFRKILKTMTCCES